MVSYSTGLSLYKKSPQFVKKCINSVLSPIPRSALLGKGFHEKLDLLLKTETWSSTDLVRFQEKKLRDLISHAYTYCPYYRDVFTNAGLHPRDIRSIEDLRKLPILTKDIIRHNFDEIVSSKYNEFKPGLAHTSGSTGEPLEFYLDQQNREAEYASVWRQIFWGGIKDLNTKIATFRGDFVYDFEKTRDVSRWDGVSKELIFNTYNLNRTTVHRIVQKLNEFKPLLIKGYPHSLYVLSQFISEGGSSLNFKPLLIQTSSEQLTLQMRETVEATFGCKIMDWYSQSEYVVSFGQCECGTYHQTMETGVMDYIEDEWGLERLVGTGLWNYSMPLINYNVDDIIDTKTDKKCACGRDLASIQSFEGRSNDIIYTPDGRAISGGGGLEVYWRRRVIPSLTVIPEYIHFTQESRNKLLIQLYCSKGLIEDDLNAISLGFNPLFGNEMDIDIMLLDQLPNTKKWKLVDSKVKRDDIFL
jgi:phenylacetate-CoA ligase